VNFGRHGRPHGIVMGWLAAYVDDHPDTDFGDNSTLRLDNDNEPQPDALLRYREGGTSSIDDEDYLVGVPELVVEVASSSTSIDTHAKKNAYRRNGIPEYIVWRVRDGAVDWFVLEAGDYVRIEPGADGVIESRRFPSLRLNVPALLASDLSAVLATQRGG
jgi:Uma2 family endonuclease